MQNILMQLTKIDSIHYEKKKMCHNCHIYLFAEPLYMFTHIIYIIVAICLLFNCIMLHYSYNFYRSRAMYFMLYQRHYISA